MLGFPLSSSAHKYLMYTHVNMLVYGFFSASSPGHGDMDLARFQLVSFFFFFQSTRYKFCRFLQPSAAFARPQLDEVCSVTGCTHVQEDPAASHSVPALHHGGDRGNTSGFSGSRPSSFNFICQQQQTQTCIFQHHSDLCVCYLCHQQLNSCDVLAKTPN